MPVRAVAFDIGGVLEVPTDTGLDGRWERRLGLQPGEFFERLRRSGLGRNANLGRVSEAESAQTLGRLYELDWPTTQELLADLWDWHYLLMVKGNQCAARRLAVSPTGAGRDSKRYLWVRWLTWIRKEKGTRACQRTGGQVRRPG